MKLSEAIRLGAMLKPQVKGGWLDGGGTCALGAAQEAVGIPARMDVMAGRHGVAYKELWRAFPVLKSEVAIPQMADVTWTLCDAIWILNDKHGWTREQIADWVAIIEAQHEAKADQQIAVGVVA